MPEERKLVTILFADVTGSTALGEELDPEDVRALMGRYYEHARRVIEEHGGTLEKFIGDAVMAVFGLPQAHGDDAERALAAALALRRVVGEDALLAGVSLRIGVNTGEVVAAGGTGSGDFLVTGDAVNVAARLQQHAQPGEVLASKRTHDAGRAAFRFGGPRSIEVKGKSEPQTVYPVEGARERRQIERPPLVGRKRELAQLELLKGWALEERRPQLVSIVAPAGTGKTRLLEEFLAGLDAEEGWHVATGRCLPYGQSLTYWPLRGLLEGLVGKIEQERIVAAFTAGGLAAEDAERLADAVLATLGVEGETAEPQEREAVFNAWRLLVEVLAKDAPRVVVFEDLHWASESLLDLVEHIMHPRTQAPLLLIAISRPELLDRRPTWGSGARENVSVLVLKPLNETQTEELVERLGGALPGSVRRRIVERSGGNPFFATELTRGLLERAGGSHSEAIPDTVHGAVLARLDGLSPSERAVVQAASVAGRTFRPATLAAMQEGLEPGQIERALEGLLARDLVVPAEGDSYVFRHVLIRDVAYGTLSRGERIRMHAAVAAWLETFAGDRLDEFVELIAYHYREAVTLSQRSAVPLPLPFDPARAIALLERAAELSARSGAFVEAANHIRSAISIAPEVEHIRLREKLADTAVGQAAEQEYEEALRLWRAAGSDDPGTGARLLRKLSIGLHRWATRESAPLTDEEIAALLPEAAALAERAGDVEELQRIRVAGVFEFYWLAVHNLIAPADAKEKWAAALEAATYFEERGDWDACSEALDAAASTAMATGSWDEVIELATRRLSLPGLPARERGDAQNMLAWALFHLSRYDECIQLVRETLAHHRAGQPLAPLAYALGWMVDAAFLLGRWDLVDEVRSVAADILDELGSSAWAQLALLSWNLLSIDLAREDRARIDADTALLDQVLERNASDRALLAAHVEDDPTLIDFEKLTTRNVYWSSIALLFCNERGVHLPDAYLDHIRSQRSLPSTPVIFVPQIDMAEAIAAGDSVTLAGAIEEVDTQQLVPHAARMRIVLAEMTGDPAPLEQARPVLERLEDRQFLRRLEDVAARIGARKAG